MGAKLHEVVGATMPAGTYWVGDPCYGIEDSRWMEWLAKSDPDVFGEGATSHAVKRVLLAELDGHAAVGIGTSHGDGTYFDQAGNEYPVDAGLIGAVPVELVTGKPFGMHRVEFERDFTVEYDDGVIVIGDIRIDTDW